MSMSPDRPPQQPAPRTAPPTNRATPGPNAANTATVAASVIQGSGSMRSAGESSGA